MVITMQWNIWTWWASKSHVRVWHCLWQGISDADVRWKMRRTSEFNPRNNRDVVWFMMEWQRRCENDRRKCANFSFDFSLERTHTAHAHQCHFHFDLVQLKSFFFFFIYFLSALDIIYFATSHTRTGTGTNTGWVQSLARLCSLSNDGTSNELSKLWLDFLQLRSVQVANFSFASLWMEINGFFFAAAFSVVIESRGCARSREIIFATHTHKWFFIRFWIFDWQALGGWCQTVKNNFKYIISFVRSACSE